jgi:ferrous iron transport protein B
MKFKELVKINSDNLLNSKKIALVGFPSSGKSSIFRLLTDFKGDSAFESTYDVKSYQAKIKDHNYTIFDLPGIHSLNSMQLTEQIAINILLNQDIDIIINVIDSTLLARGLKLTIELIELGLPIILVINFSDELKVRGINLDKNKMQELLKIPVVLMNARSGKGLNELVDDLLEIPDKDKYIPTIFQYTKHIEQYVSELAELLKDSNCKMNGNPRFYAIKTLEDINFLPEEIRIKVKNKVDSIQETIFKEHNLSLFETISYERHHHAMKIAEESAPYSKNTKIPIQDYVDSFLSHSVWGYFSLIFLLILFFITIFYIGSELSSLFEPPLQSIATLFEPLKNTNPFLWFSINGAYQGLLGALGIVLPYFLPLVFLTSILEETGYMSRIVLLIDNIMHKVGLHGKSIIPFIMGVGCSVPALYSTRLLENRRDRIITAILVPFIPCSARITVIFALSAAFAGPIWAVIIFIYIFIIIAIGSSVLNKILPQSSGLMMEITPLRIPSIKLALQKTWSKVSEFLGEALLFLVLGGIVLGWVEFFNISHYIDIVFSPIVHSIMNLPDQLGSTLLFGFLRKELILVMANQAMGVDTLSKLPLSIPQVVTFIIFVSLYFPCLSTFIVLLKEYKLKITLISSFASIILAIFSAILFRIFLNLIY